jgi:ribonuclease G
MAKEICISSTPHETRLAILEDDQLAEIYYERENEYTLAGSIYNGRVTRVLPGMQSAFVDVGLERDAFLYVTDFLELEDAEETDELEKAAVAGGNQPPREVRHAPEQTNGQMARTGGRGDDRGQRPGQRPVEKQEPRPERQPRGRRMAVEAVPEAAEALAPESPAVSEQTGSAQEDSGAPGAKRWRGRRHRRGGRGAAGAPMGQVETGSSEETTESYPQAPAEADVAPVIHATTGVPTSAPERPTPRSGRSPVPVVLPGESLRKYGGMPEEDAPKSAQESAAPVRPASTFKPATLIEAPLVWDGSGLLPGESLSKHRGRRSEPDTIAEPEESAAAPDEIEEEEFLTGRVQPAPESIAETEVETTPDEIALEAAEDYLVEENPLEPFDSIEEDEFEETAEAAPYTHAAPAAPSHAETGNYAVETVTEEATVDEPVAAQVTEQEEAAPTLETGQSSIPESLEFEETESEETPSDASASHHVDPVRPTGFRLFGFGKKKDEKAAPAKAKTVSVSSYAPGRGLIEEEIIEGEEFDAPRHPHHGKAEEHDLDDFEEETLPTHLRTGDLGEMLQEAHLDHRIQMNFDSKEGDVAFDEEEDESAAAGQPSTGDAQALQRRGRRGRGAPAASGALGRRGPSRRAMQTSDLPIISDLLKSGQEILVQIAKEPIAKKGARITSHIALPGRFLVFMPTVSHIGVSRKIASEEERHRLKRILVHERGEASGGFIVRTAAEGASEEELRTDLRMLLNLWAEIKKRSDESKSPALIYHDLGLIERILRDQVSTNFSSIWVDSEADYERIVRFLNRFSPSLVRRVKLYTKETPLFEHFGIQDEISKALRSKVWLKSGGSIVINQTEALVAIDINTGKYVGKSARLEDTIVKTNLDAVPEIVRQIRLRDLGGIIVIDFIDMDDRKNRFKVLAALEEALKSDRAPTKVLQFNDFGLVAITRKRVKQSLERTLSVPCPVCQATGMVKSPTTVCNEIYVELRKMKKHFEGADVMLRVNPETVKVLKSNGGTWLTEFEELIGKNILVKSDPTLHPEQFDIQG